ATQINFSITKESSTTLTVYNMIGQKVGTLVDRILAAGNYKVDFDASDLSSGIYIYVLRAENKVLIKKMVFLK
ncbi:MAG TPA: T9SS type A sorting domain-containing protein, partial [Ignavibacteria bacterium]|nr:T9SS type A sorting domain-containing protein [Ignavibacteria bacterium]